MAFVQITPPIQKGNYPSEFHLQETVSEVHLTGESSPLVLDLFQLFKGEAFSFQVAGKKSDSIQYELLAGEGILLLSAIAEAKAREPLLLAVFGVNQLGETSLKLVKVIRECRKAS